MKEQIKTLLVAVAVLSSSTAIADTPIANNGAIKIEITCQKIENVGTLNGTHRTPVQIPNVYLNQESNTLYFENPCYECTLELVIPGTDTSVYTAVIPDGDNAVQLPTDLVGLYELHIHRGNFCFWGLIEL